MGKRTAIYARISQDPQGRREGVEAQVEWGREYARKHWPDLPVEVFADNDISAAKDDVHRPEFERLREWIQAGKVKHLWVSWQSRLARNELTWHLLVNELRAAGITELHTRHEGIRRIDDIATNIMASVDAHYVRELTTKILDKKNVLAHAGRPAGAHGFGYRNVAADAHDERRAWQRARWQARREGVDMDAWSRQHPRPQAPPLVDEHGRKRIEQVPVEAAALREAAERILAGWTLTNVADDLNRRGLFGAHGADWYFASLKRRLLSPTIAGLRVHHDEIVGKAKWEPILDETTWRAVKAKLTNDRTWTASNGAKVRIPAAHPRNRAGAVHTHLLSGVAVCGVCHARLAGTIARGRHDYRCQSAYGGRNCVTIAAVDLEEWVRDELLAKLDNAEFVAAFAADDHADRRGEIADALRDVEGRRGEVADRWNARELTTTMFDSMNRALIAEERDLNRELASLPTPLRRVDPEDVRGGWHKMVFDERREVIVTYIDRVIVNRLRVGRVRQADVAAAAGVAQITVSMAVGRNRKADQISDATRERVRKVAADLGYQPITATTAGDRAQIRWRRPQGGCVRLDDVQHERGGEDVPVNH